MSFTIPNAVGLTYPDQAAPDQRDFDILTAGVAGVGVLSGCAVSASGSSLVLMVTSGTVQLGLSVVGVAGNTATIGAAHATNPRYDLVVTDSTGVASIIAGTAAASPVFPSFSTSSQVVLAAVYVPATATTLAAANLVDKRVMLFAAQSDELNSVLNAQDFTIPNTGTYTNVPGMQITIPAGVPWKCLIYAQLWGTRNATADATNKNVQLRCVDAATSTIVYGGVIWQDPFATASVNYLDTKVGLKLNDPLAAETVVKLQAFASNNANLTWKTYNSTVDVPGCVLQAVRR